MKKCIYALAYHLKFCMHLFGGISWSD